MYEVKWTGAARAQLANAWIDAPARRAVTEAVESIDARLGHDPEQEGESREGDRRVLIEPPLGIRFEVDSARKVVIIRAIWSFRTGRRDR